uniref:Peptide arylation enzyme n=1 Tax=Eubacterium cellulosolvens (strain ATCC 43171 / JCM 9499 / 6) TaxID=633697 RepID=I5AX02_EUBC6
MNFDEEIRLYESSGILSRETVVDRFLEMAKRYPEKIAVYDAEGAITYRQLSDRLLSFGGFLSSHGIERGDRVILQIGNSRDYAVVLLGTMAAGAVPVLMLQEHRSAEISCVGNTVEAKAYVSVNSGFIGNWKEMTEEVVASVAGLKLLITGKDSGIEGNIPLYDLQEAYLWEENRENRSVYNIPAVFLLSGGTTGAPKIIPKLQEAYLYNVERCAERSRFDEKTVFLTPLSVSHDFALANPGMLGALLKGGTVVLPELPFPEEAFDMIEEYGVNVVTIVPALLQGWLEAARYSGTDFSSLQLIITGAAKIDRSLGEQVKEVFGVKIQNGYGLGEGISCFTEIDDEDEVALNTQGKPVSRYDIMRIINEDGIDVSRGEEGELIEKGPYTFGGYYKNDTLNKTLFTEDGFFRTGDKAKMDVHGNLVILGRVREQINRAGENVIPSEVETLLRKCSSVKDASVFGAEDEKMGEKTVAALIADTQIHRKQIVEEMLAMGVAAYKIPDEIMIVTEFPYKNIGKVDKKELCRRYENGRKVKK